MRIFMAAVIVAGVLVARAAIAAEPSGTLVGATQTSSSASMIKVQEILGQTPGQPRASEATPSEPAQSAPSNGAPSHGNGAHSNGNGTDSTAANPAAANAAAGAKPGAPGDPALAKKAGGKEQPPATTATNSLLGSAAGTVPATGRDYYVRATMQYRRLFIADQDFLNDHGMYYAVSAGYKPFANTAVFMGLGMTQAFIADPDESGFLLRDLVLGAKYTWKQSLDGIGLEGEKLTLTGGLNAYLPTSRASINQDLYFAPEGSLRASYQVAEGVTAELAFSFQYRFNKYAERDGMGGGMNRQLQFGPTFTLDYAFYEDAEVGVFDAGFDLRNTTRKSYASRDDHQSSSSDQVFWNQDFGWDIFLSYLPNDWLVATLSLEQNAPLRRDGLRNFVLLNRDDTELVFTLTAQY